jgi:hypothetical protein
MEDVVAVRFQDAERGEGGVLTWGRVFDPVDPTPLLEAIARILPRAGFKAASDIRICGSLREARQFRYFYEGLVHFSALAATEDVGDPDWLKLHRTDDCMLQDLYRLGLLMSD